MALAAVGMVACLFFAKPVDKGAWASGQNVSDAPNSENTKNTSTESSGAESPGEVSSAEGSKAAGESGPEPSGEGAETGSKP